MPRSTGAVVEDVHTPGLGTVDFTDVDLTDDHSVSAALASTDYAAASMGSFSVVETTDTTGTGTGGVMSWTYDIDNAAAQQLAVGQVVTEVYTITINDNEGDTVEQDVTITITGTNDAPVAVDGTAGTLENTILNANVPSASDVDGTIVSYALGGTTVAEGTLTFNADGSYSFDPGTDFDDLAPCVSRDVTFTYTAIDNNGASTGEQTVIITVTGSNDLPVIGGVTTATIVEDVDVSGNTIGASGQLTITDADAGHASFTAATINGAHGVLTIDTSGSWSYRADNNTSDIQSLRFGDTLVETLTVTTFDGTNHDIVVRIDGSEEPDTTGSIRPEDPDPVPEETQPESKLPEPPEASINEEVLTALQEFDAEEIYTNPQIRDPQLVTDQDPDGISQYSNSQPSESTFIRTFVAEQRTVAAPESTSQAINIDSLRFESSDDESL